MMCALQLVYGVAFAVSVAAGRVLVSEADAGVSLSRFSEVVDRARGGNADARIGFARTALDVMIEAYADELDKAAPAAGEDAAQRRRKHEWRAGALEYLGDLRRVRRQVVDGAAITIIPERYGAVRMVIDREQIIIGGPRLADQDRLEASIAQRVCDAGHCRRDHPTVEEHVDSQQAALRQGWVFEGSAPPVYATSDGLNCVFRDRKHIKLKQVACESLMRELRLLATSLKAVDQRGFPVNWANVDIRRRGPTHPHEVTYDSEGRYFQLRLPVLYGFADVWRQALPWIQAYVAGAVRQHYIEPPERLVYVARAP